MAKKYIDAEKLKAEIEGIRWFPQISSGYNDGREDMKIMVLDIIDSLLQEQPEVDLEKEIERWMDLNADSNGFYNMVNYARHFYELGKNSK